MSDTDLATGLSEESEITELTPEPPILGDAPSADKPEDKPQDEKKWDEQKQRIDQAEAAAKVLGTKAEGLAVANEQMQTELAESRDQMTALEAKVAESARNVQAEADALDDMDADVTDKAVIRNLNKLQVQNAALQKQLTEQSSKYEKLEEKASAYEQNEQQRQNARHKDQVTERILTPLDDEFGAKHRNAAMKMADRLVDTGQESQPQDAIAGMTLMRKCYKEVSKVKEPKESVPSDSGGGGIQKGGSRKTGSRAEVLADMKKDKSWKT